MIKCPSCKGLYMEFDGPTHSYMASSAGCWQAYSELLAKEYSDLKYWENHRLTVDSYAVQHPGVESKQSIQSVAVHLVSLCLVLENNISQSYATESLKKLTSYQFHWLIPPTDMGQINVNTVLIAQDHVSHNAAVKDWAHSVWRCWKEHHQTVRKWARFVCDTPP